MRHVGTHALQLLDGDVLGAEKIDGYEFDARVDPVVWEGSAG